MSDFTIGSPGSRGLLNPDDLNFFYYDVALNSLDGWVSCCDWNNDIEDFINGNNLRIDFSGVDDIPESVNCGTILFTIDPIDNNSKVAAFLRHLRNSFSHFRINRDRDNYIMTDYSRDIKKTYHDRKY
jgi:hypothetical protein